VNIDNATDKTMTKGVEQALILLAMQNRAKAGRLVTQYPKATLRSETVRDPLGATFTMFRVRFSHGNGSADHEEACVSEDALLAFIGEGQMGVRLEAQRESLATITGHIDDVRAKCEEAVDAIQNEPWQQFTDDAQDAVFDTLDKLRAAASLCDEAEQLLGDADMGGTC